MKLPGAVQDKPNVYDFDCTYAEIYKDLVQKDKQLYTQNGLLHMLDRNKRIKPKPERFRDCPDEFDVVICAEERVYDQVLEGNIANNSAKNLARYHFTYSKSGSLDKVYS